MQALVSLQSVLIIFLGNFSRDCHETDRVHSVKTPVIDLKAFWEGVRNVLKTETWEEVHEMEAMKQTGI